ncbi:MAG: ribosome-associated translation inhibitor RaiA [Clostridiales bacterium]|jgi:putative sigma-54 modulation protein|nr:ribosome-associated translation inhibitor RaiA [Clostridiales bacterium]
MLKFTFTGKNLIVTDALKDRAMQKLGRLEKLLPFDADVNVKFSLNRQNNRVEVTIPVRRRILRAEVTANDMYAALDSIVDMLEKQMIKYKSRIRNRSRRDDSFREEFEYAGDVTENTDETPIVIDRTKQFPLKPMDAEEAVMEMEMLGHSFYVFRNGHTDIVNVVYKRNDGAYGLIEPEY